MLLDAVEAILDALDILDALEALEWDLRERPERHDAALDADVAMLAVDPGDLLIPSWNWWPWTDDS